MCADPVLYEVLEESKWESEVQAPSILKPKMRSPSGLAERSRLQAELAAELQKFNNTHGKNIVLVVRLLEVLLVGAGRRSAD